MGIGLYFIFPVAYTDVTDLWHMPKKTRIIVTLGGIYIEYIYSLILFIFSIILQNQVVGIAGISIFIFSILQFNPLLRYDGYWMLCDILETPNLRKNSLKKLVQFLKNINAFSSLSFKDKMVLIYAFCSICFSVFIFFILFTKFNTEIITLPFLLIGLIFGHNSLNEIKPGHLFSLIFYYLMIKIIYKIYSKLAAKIKIKIFGNKLKTK